MTINEATEAIITTIKLSTETELELTPQTHLIKELGLSSVEAMLLLSDLEDQFCIHIPASQLRRIQTVDDLCQTIINLLMEP